MMKNIIKSFIVLSAAAVLFAACAEKEQPVGLDPYATNFVYMNAPKTDTYNASFTMTKEWKERPDSVQILSQIRCTKPAEEDIQITLTIDESMVAVYNEANGTDYKFLPEVKLVEDEFVIRKGEYISADTLKVEHTDVDTILEGESTMYLVPVKISSISGSGTISESNTMYVFYNATMLLAEVKNSYDAEGVKVSDRKAWKLKATGGYGYTQAGYLTDGASWTDDWWYDPFVIDIDFGQTYTNIKSIGVDWYYGYAYCSSTIEVLLSTDGVNYTNTGIYSSVVTPSAVISFYEPQQASHVRLNFGAPASSYTDIGEIYITTAE